MDNSSIPTRRSFVGGALALGALPTGAAAAPAPTLIGGTYANEGGPGLVSLKVGANGIVAGAAIARIGNASFEVKSARRGIHYLVDEQTQGGLGVYDGAFRQLAKRPTLGADPCHAALSPDGTMLAVANYSSGSVALWRLDRAGLPQGDAQLVRHEGRGPNSERQAGPHAHWVGFAANGTLLHSVDLGADAIFAHHLDAATGAVTHTSIAYRAVAGSGPRHLARHPRLPVAYLVAELANTVTILRSRADGTFAARSVVSTLPAAFHGDSAAAHISLNRAGTRLYVSNRGHNSIAVFAVDADGDLRLLQHIDSGGNWPRLFVLLDDQGTMLVANQRSGTIARLNIMADGRLATTDQRAKVAGIAFIGA
ncbi:MULTISPECIES: lactonase family protein [unclassified Sphingomonas]|uniref:lactonase family protein n=1 Tax=unclassified Sphingomonas TaxID=196159 RepID=UPI00226AC8D1|nr:MULTISPECIES: lactonase family protein [unclassified Sphingomonas]